MRSQDVLRELREQANGLKARELERYFKTGPGEYAEGDVFLGLTVPVIRTIARRYSDISNTELKRLFPSHFHEARFCALVILVNKFNGVTDPKEAARFFNLYLNELRRGRVNNWDLVDVSAPTLGRFLLTKKNSRNILIEMSRHDNLWVRRTAILFTFASLRIGETKPTLDISTKLLEDDHDLIQKAVGWALREVGKISAAQLRSYLKKHGRQMSRTTLRYAIERFSAHERKRWLTTTR